MVAFMVPTVFKVSPKITKHIFLTPFCPRNSRQISHKSTQEQNATCVKIVLKFVKLLAPYGGQYGANRLQSESQSDEESAFDVSWLP